MFWLAGWCIQRISSQIIRNGENQRTRRELREGLDTPYPHLYNTPHNTGLTDLKWLLGQLIISNKLVTSQISRVNPEWKIVRWWCDGGRHPPSLWHLSLRPRPPSSTHALTDSSNVRLR